MTLVRKVRAKTFSNQGLTYCRPEKARQPLLAKINQSDGGKHCPTCHFRVRGANHDQGSQHTSGKRIQ